MNHHHPSNSMSSMSYDSTTMPRINDLLSNTSTPTNNQYYESNHYNTMVNECDNNINTPKSCISSGMAFERDNYMNRNIDYLPNSFDDSFDTSMHSYDTKYENINGHSYTNNNNNNTTNTNNNYNILPLPVYSNNNSNSTISSSNTSAISSCRSSIDESVYNDNNNVNVTISNVNIYNNTPNCYDTENLNVMPQITNTTNTKFNFNGYDQGNNNNNNGCNTQPIYDANINNNNSHSVEHIQKSTFYLPQTHTQTYNNKCNNNCNYNYNNNNNTNNGCNFTVCDLPNKQPKNENNLPFIKTNNFIYGSYKQKYVYSNGCSNDNINIKNEIYRQRHNILNRNESEQPIKIKIKGTNFESLVKRLTFNGDNTRCIECKRTFYQKCHLFRHIRDIHLIKNGIHSCPFCIKTFHQKSNLDTHCMTHAKDRKFSHPFKCIICIKNGKDKCFTRKSSLKRHCQTKHKNISIDSEWINKQQTPKWNPILKTFVFNPIKNKININKISQKLIDKYTNEKL